MSTATPPNAAPARLTDRSGIDLYGAFIICLIVVSLPIKNLAYVAPLVYLALQFRSGNVRLLVRVMMLTALVAMVSLLAIVWDSLRMQSVNLPGVAMGALTYLPLLIVLCERFNRVIDEKLYQRFVNVCCWFVIVQSTIGLLQFSAFGNSDAVCGTYGLLDGMHSSITIAQVYFTFTIFGMLLFMLPEIRRPLVASAFVVGLLACVAAQSGHQTIFLAAAFCSCAAIGVFRLKMVVISGALVTALIGFVLLFFPETYELSQAWYRKAIDNPHSPKRVVIDGGMQTLQDGKNALLGVGLGQYSSRAALITSNSYLSVELPAVLSGQSDYFTTYVEQGQAVFDASGEGSAIAKPYFTLLSLPVELGLLQFAALCMVFAACFWRQLRWMRSPDRTIAWIGFSANVAIVFFLLCCLIENYAEFAQAIFLPLLLFVVALSRIRTREKQSEATAHA